MTGNVLGAVMNIVSIFGDSKPSPEQQILEQKRIQAQQVVVTAQGAADANRETAAGQADANRSINESITDELIQWQAIQKLNPNVNVMVVPDDGNFIFSLPSSPPAPTPTTAP